MKFMVRMAKQSWQDYKTNEDIELELKIDPDVKKVQNYRRKKRTTCSKQKINYEGNGIQKYINYMLLWCKNVWKEDNTAAYADEG